MSDKNELSKHLLYTHKTIKIAAKQQHFVTIFS